MTFGEKLKKKREEKGLTQKALGERLGVSQQAIAQYEAAEYAPKERTIKRLTEALGEAELSPALEFCQNLRKTTNEIGLRIKNRRKELRMSQESLAERTGYIEKSAIAKIELGRVNLTIPKLYVFASALNVTPEELIFPNSSHSKSNISERSPALEFGRSLRKTPHGSASAFWPEYFR